jgi:integrase
MEQNGIRITGDKNPAAKVERYRERAPDISFLSLEQIDQQLKALEEYPDLQVMVAVYIYGGLRREELCWLQEDDIDFTAGVHGMIRVRAKTVNGSSWEPKLSGPHRQENNASSLKWRQSACSWSALPRF